MFSLLVTLVLLSLTSPSSVLSRETQRESPNNVKPESRRSPVEQRDVASSETRPVEDVVPLVVGSSIIVPDTHNATLERQQYEDVVYSTLFAQLESDKTLSDEDPSTSYRLQLDREWFPRYANVTSNVGWLEQKFSLFNWFNEGTDLETVDFHSDSERGGVTNSEQAVIRQSLDLLLSSCSSESLLSMSNGIIRLGKYGVFQVGIVTNKSGTVLLKLFSFYMETFPSVTRTHGKLHVMELNETRYNQVRPLVAEKLGTNSNELITPIKKCDHNHGSSGSAWGGLCTSMLFACFCVHAALRSLF
ncbi:uncharacterized protein LOC134176151 [Corticium candelabrum]|uniref:uncharacterized protein LOC134176151 n=1 Tax=Corticium candelabrum TaxID=121492 RepID=UPI002E267E01|nr:uncharacterized protein LOC134176151 [Corticium candelabrum]